MLVILMDNQILASQHICHNCLLADQNGQPRWRQGQLRCGQMIHKPVGQPDQYQCMMGFRVVNIE